MHAAGLKGHCPRVLIAALLCGEGCGGIAALLWGEGGGGAVLEAVLEDDEGIVEVLWGEGCALL